MWWLMSLTMYSFTQYDLTFSFTPVSSSFGICIFSSHVVAYIEALIQAPELENRISYGHGMRFLLHVVARVSHYVVFYTILPYLFIHSSQLEFRNLVFFIPCRSLYRSFDSSS